MPIADDIKKTLSDPTPLYALAGAGDLAYEKLREVPGRVESLAADRKVAQEKAAAKLHEAQTRLVEAQTKLTETVTTLPTDLRTLQEKAQTFALQQVGRAAEFAVRAKETYDDLAVRGKAVVERGAGDYRTTTVEVIVDAESEPGVADGPIEGELIAGPQTGAAASDAPSDAPKKNGRPRKAGTTK